VTISAQVNGNAAAEQQPRHPPFSLAGSCCWLIMTKHSHERDEYVSGIRSGLRDAFRTDSSSPDDPHGAPCRFCEALRESDDDTEPRRRKGKKG
jgi:hypothetical protein